MLSKTVARATALALVLLTLSCAGLPWRREPEAGEVNLAFTLERNLVELRTVRMNDQPGRYLLATAAPRTIVASTLRPARRWTLQITDKETLRVSPATLDLRGVAEGIIGADAWGKRAISIDYRKGLVTYQKRGIETGLMTVFRYRNEPSIYVNVNGVDVAAIVDTSSPDTLVLPRTTRGRANVNVSIAGTNFGSIDVQYADVRKARIGNRLLAHYLVSIDYGNRLVGLWRDPRTPIAESSPEPRV